MLRRSPLRTRIGLVAGWLALGLRVDPTRRDAILGWAVRSRSHDHVVLGLDSVLGLSAELVVARRDGTWWFATVLTLRTRAARAAWAAIEPVHLRVVPALLADAARRADRPGRRRDTPE